MNFLVHLKNQASVFDSMCFRNRRTFSESRFLMSEVLLYRAASGLLHHGLVSDAERLVIYCQTTSVSAAHATHCVTYCTPCRPLIRAFSGRIRSLRRNLLLSLQLETQVSASLSYSVEQALLQRIVRPRTPPGVILTEARCV